MLTLLQTSCKMGMHCRQVLFLAGGWALLPLQLPSSLLVKLAKQAAKLQLVKHSMTVTTKALEHASDSPACCILPKAMLHRQRKPSTALTTCKVLASTTSGMLASIASRGNATRQCSTSALVRTLPTRVPYDQTTTMRYASHNANSHVLVRGEVNLLLIVGRDGTAQDR